MGEYRHLSKFLSLVLRHRPELLDISLDQNGWCDVNDLIDGMRRKGKLIDLKILKAIVESDNKQRYSFDDDHSKIRANQGHSMSVDLGLEEKEPPEFLYHGTVERFVESILEKGLIKGQRQYVHLSKDIETAQKVASRRGEGLILKISSRKMYRDGYKFYLSKNLVWLCDTVPREYISINE